MDSFDLGRLNGNDFETVCRDLLSDVLGVRLEMFSPGKDQGIDLRHAPAGGPLTVVQCKHWPRASQSHLIHKLIRDELPKLAASRTDRYIIATSVLLTVDGKRRLLEAFHPYVRSTGDIYGGVELVEELRRRPELVERHFRLWLSSTHVLQTVLNREIYLRSAWLLQRIPELAGTFVEHEAFARARELLEARHVCLISGIPGSGKTTIALMLTAWLAGRGYSVCEVSGDIGEVATVWRDGVPQVFLYDDFLGATTLDSGLTKNEDSRLLELVRRVANTPDKALVMTTRGYILEQARQRYDKLSAPEMQAVASTIELRNLSRIIKAQILYNHVCHADIAPERKREFAVRGAWEPIVHHRNFNPRVIEATLRLTQADDRRLPATMLENLDNPQAIWERIVENDLNDEAVQILEVLFTFERAGVDELKECWSWYRKEMDLADDGRAFRRALQMLEGTMVVVDAGEVAFHNPSVQDYIRFHLGAGRARLRELIRAAGEARQIRNLLDAAELSDGEPLRSLLKAIEPDVVRAVRGMDETLEWSTFDENDGLPMHLVRCIDVAEMLDSSAIVDYVLERSDHDLIRTESNALLFSLAEALAYSRIVPEERSTRFCEGLGAEIESCVLYSLEQGHWDDACEDYELLRQVPKFAEDASLEQKLIDLGLVQLRGYAATDVEELRRYPIIELTDFLWNRVPGIEATEENKFVTGVAASVESEWKKEHAAFVYSDDESGETDVAHDARRKRRPELTAFEKSVKAESESMGSLMGSLDEA